MAELRLGGGLVLIFGLNRFQRVVKRLLDLGFSLIAMIVLLPLLIALGITVWASSPGSMLYRGERVGQGGRRFRILKFRSMIENAEQHLRDDSDLAVLHRASGFKLHPEYDSRITPVGRFLRRTSLDELPQLWNILMGHMSVVGARPVVPDELSDYGELASVYLVSRPGLTGHWQIVGRGVVGFPDRAYLDLLNVQDWSLRRDLSLILRTIPAVLTGRGAY